MKTKTLKILFLLTVAAGGYWTVHVFRYRPLQVQSVSEEKPLYAKGVIHVHSTFSDGSGTFEEIRSVAKEAGLDFVIFTDHTKVQKPLPSSGWQDDILQIVGREGGIEEGGHYLALGLPDLHYSLDRQPRGTLNEVKELGGHFIIAHPLGHRFLWKGEELPGATGIELMNAYAWWRQSNIFRQLQAYAAYPLNPVYGLLYTARWDSRTEKFWFRHAQRAPTVILGGLDAHARMRLSRKVNLKYPSYDALFRLMQIHVLLDAPFSGDDERDTTQILGSLAEGKIFIALESLAQPAWINYWAEQDGKRYEMGSTIREGKKVSLNVRVSQGQKTQILLYRDEQVISTIEGTSVQYETEKKGIYRVEVYLKGHPHPAASRVPWIVSNPIYIRSKEWKPYRHPLQLSHPILSEHVLSLDPSQLSFEYDASSELSGVKEGDALKVNFRLGLPKERREGVYTALRVRSLGDPSVMQGVSFKVRGDQAYRVTLRLREPESASPDGYEDWGRSFPIRKEWEQINLEFSHFLLMTPGGNGQFEPGRTEALFLIWDQSNTRFGTKGSLWLKDMKFVKYDKSSLP